MNGGDGNTSEPDEQEKEYMRQLEEAQNALLSASKDDVKALKKQIADLEDQLRQAQVRSVGGSGGNGNSDELQKLVD